MENNERRLLLDASTKYFVLVMFSTYVGFYIYRTVATGKELNMPDWVVMLFTLVFQYFFRRSPKENGHYVQETNSKSPAKDNSPGNN